MCSLLGDHNSKYYFPADSPVRPAIPALSVFKSSQQT